ncbi:hypothetical protein BpHYR1_007750 [Brachionus plicatilis]|uniref:Uncharacterized protein n=1 Tax=Brachionus plicatilis TaxID=10195 RepID=A0A3M7RNS6_BRAPC|nr:hypothetical protein BpHYR1_007750 [Brachionus plicatilis]
MLNNSKKKERQIGRKLKKLNFLCNITEKFIKYTLKNTANKGKMNADAENKISIRFKLIIAKKVQQLKI